MAVIVPLYLLALPDATGRVWFLVGTEGGELEVAGNSPV